MKYSRRSRRSRGRLVTDLNNNVSLLSAFGDYCFAAWLGFSLWLFLFCCLVIIVPQLSALGCYCFAALGYHRFAALSRHFFAAFSIRLLLFCFFE